MKPSNRSPRILGTARLMSLDRWLTTVGYTPHNEEAWTKTYREYFYDKMGFSVSFDLKTNKAGFWVNPATEIPDVYVWGLMCMDLADCAIIYNNFTEPLTW